MIEWHAEPIFQDKMKEENKSYICLSLIDGTITKTCLYNFDPLKPHFDVVKLWFTGVYIIFLILLKT